MAALSANAAYTTKPAEIVNVPVLSGATIYNGALCCCDTTSGGAAKPYSGTIGQILLGWHFGDVNDDGSSSPTKTAKIARGGFIVLGLTVAGLGGSNVDIGKKVYATNDGTYTVTDPTTHTAHVGHVSGNATASVADVLFVPSVFGQVSV